MEKERIPVYESYEILELEGSEGIIDCHAHRIKQGFPDKREIATPYHYNDNSFFDIYIYSNEKYESICELWDHNGAIFFFATKNESQTFKLIKEMLSFVKDHSTLEKNVSEMENGIKFRRIEED